MKKRTYKTLALAVAVALTLMPFARARARIVFQDDTKDTTILSSGLHIDSNAQNPADVEIEFGATTEILKWDNTQEAFSMTDDILVPAGSYVNFGTTSGALGYGFGDNSGSVEFKDSGGSWIDLSALTGSGTNSSVTLDDAYDGGGSGVGRTVTVDSGAIQFSGSNAADETLEVSTSANGGAVLIENTGTGDSLVVNDEASDTTPFVIDDSGKVGIGDTTPTVKLDVKAASTVGTSSACQTDQGGTCPLPNDMTSGGTYTGAEDGRTYVVAIDGTGTPDTFQWSEDGGSTWEATGVTITGAAQSLSDGVTVTFTNTTGHSAGDYWTFTVNVTNPFALQNAAGSYFMIAGNDGKVGIGTTTPSYKLDVVADDVTGSTAAAYGASNSFTLSSGDQENTAAGFVSTANLTGTATVTDGVNTDGSIIGSMGTVNHQSTATGTGISLGIGSVGYFTSSTADFADVTAAYGSSGILTANAANTVASTITTGAGVSGQVGAGSGAAKTNFTTASGVAGLVNIEAGANTINISSASALRAGSTVNDGTNSTVDYNYGLYVEDQTAGTSDYGVYIAGADTYALEVAADDVLLNDNLFIGSGSESLSDPNFDPSASLMDLYVGGAAGVEGKVYTDDSFVVGDTTGTSLKLTNNLIRQTGGGDLVVETQGSATGDVYIKANNAAGSIYFLDARATNIPFTLNDSAIDATLGQGVIDAINDLEGEINNIQGSGPGGSVDMDDVYDNDANKILAVDNSSGLEFESGAAGGNIVFDLQSTYDLVIQDAGTPFAIFDDSGNVGIGTVTTPQSELHVADNSDSGGSGRITLGHAEGTTGEGNLSEIVFRNETNGAGKWGLYVTSDKFSATTAYNNNVRIMQYRNSADNNVNLARLVIDDSGDVGIGDDMPDHKLDVAGNIGLDAGGYINFGDTDGASGYGFGDNSGSVEFKDSGGSWIDLSALTGSGTNSSVTLDDAYNNFGASVSTITVDAAESQTGGLKFAGSLATDETMTVSNSDNGGAVLIENTGTGDSLVVNDEASDTTPFVIDDSGNVAIGTTTPVNKLDVILGDGEKVYLDATTARTGTAPVFDIDATNIDTTTDSDNVEVMTIDATRASGDTGELIGIDSSMVHSGPGDVYGGSFNVTQSNISGTGSYGLQAISSSVSNDSSAVSIGGIFSGTGSGTNGFNVGVYSIGKDETSASAYNVGGYFLSIEDIDSSAGSAAIAAAGGSSGAGVVTDYGLWITDELSGYTNKGFTTGIGIDASTMTTAFQIQPPSGTTYTTGIDIDNSASGTITNAIVTDEGNVIFNESGSASADFRVEGDTEANLLFVDASVDGIGINEATPAYKLDIKATSAIGADSCTGTCSLDDLTPGGTYIGGVNTTYRVQIDSTGTPDTFKWSNDGGSTFEATGVSITGGAQSLDNGVTITFGATTGHTLNDYWDFAVTVTNPLGIQNATGTVAGIIRNDGFAGFGDSTPAAQLVVGSDAGAAQANGAGDAYIQNDLEVDGIVYASDLSCTDCLDFDSFEDALNVDANTAINLGTYTLDINMDSSGVFSIQDGGSDIAQFTAGGAISFDPTSGQNFSATTLGVGDIALTSADAFDIDAAGTLSINSSAGVINVGNDAVAQNINVGTGTAARTIAIGNTTGATAVTLDAGTNGITASSTGDTTFSLTDAAADSTFTITNSDGTYEANLSVEGDGSFGSNLTVGGNTTLGNATSDTITFTGRAASSLLPTTDNTYDLGSTSLRWRDIFLGPNTLHIGTSATDEGTISYDTTGNILNFSTDGTTAGDIAFNTNDLFIDTSASAVGIGTAAPSAKLDVTLGATDKVLINATTARTGTAPVFDIDATGINTTTDSDTVNVTTLDVTRDSSDTGILSGYSANVTNSGEGDTYGATFTTALNNTGAGGTGAGVYGITSSASSTTNDAVNGAVVIGGSLSATSSGTSAFNVGTYSTATNVTAASAYNIAGYFASIEDIDSSAGSAAIAAAGGSSGAGVVTDYGLWITDELSGYTNKGFTTGIGIDASTMTTAFQIQPPSGRTYTTGIDIDNSASGTITNAIVTDEGNVIFNESGSASADFRVEGDTDANLLFIDAGQDAVGINNASPITTLDVTGTSRTSGPASSVLTGSIDPIASTTVTGVGTAFLSELVIGDRITVTGETRTVTAIASDTSLTVDVAFSDNANDTSPDRLGAELVVRDSSDNIDFLIKDTGDIGIGTATPGAKLDIRVTDAENNEGIYIDTEESSSTQDVFSIETDTTNGSGIDTLKFTIKANGDVYNDGAVYSSPADFAEYFYDASATLTPGDLVAIDPLNPSGVRKAIRGDAVIGIVSTNPAFVGNTTDDKVGNPNWVIVSLAGQIPAKVNTQNGPIAIGDLITISDTDGVGMKADAGEASVGIAMGALSAGSGSIQVLVSRNNNANGSAETGWLGSDRIKILPRDFMADNLLGSLGLMDKGGMLQKTAMGTGLTATQAIPTGYRATEVAVYSQNTGPYVTVYECSIIDNVCTSMGTGNTNSPITITPLESSPDNYISIYVNEASGNNNRSNVYGGYIEIEPIN